eukprot:362428-Chlamydomonas_euryale.AAC.3
MPHCLLRTHGRKSLGLEMIAPALVMCKHGPRLLGLGDQSRTAAALPGGIMLPVCDAPHTRSMPAMRHIRAPCLPCATYALHACHAPHTRS